VVRHCREFSTKKKKKKTTRTKTKKVAKKTKSIENEIDTIMQEQEGFIDLALYPALKDNYGFNLLAACGDVVAIDPPDANAFLSDIQYFLSAHEMSTLSVDNVKYILNTHHHHDHAGANKEIMQSCRNVKVIAPGLESNQIFGVTQKVKGGDVLRLYDTEIQVIDVSGHTKGHVAYYLPETGVVFAGDAIFPMGCGRIFEGTAEDSYHAIQRLMGLPNETKIFTAHEYTEANVAFALSVDPENEELQKRAEKIKILRSNTVPKDMAEDVDPTKDPRFYPSEEAFDDYDSEEYDPNCVKGLAEFHTEVNTNETTVRMEKLTNPFVRLPTYTLEKSFESKSPIEVFAELRKLKDKFTS